MHLLNSVTTAAWAFVALRVLDDHTSVDDIGSSMVKGAVDLGRYIWVNLSKILISPRLDIDSLGSGLRVRAPCYLLLR